MTLEGILCHKTSKANNQNKNLQSTTYSKHDLKNAVEMKNFESKLNDVFKLRLVETWGADVWLTVDV